MGLFSKPEYQPILLDYRFGETDGCFPCIEAYGDVFGQMKYCGAYYEISTRAIDMYKDGRYQKMVNDFRDKQGKQKIEVLIKLKKGKPVGFKIDLERLSETIGNPDIVNLGLLGWGFNDTPDPDL